MWRFLRAALDILLPRKERAMRIDAYSLSSIALALEEHDACGVRITTLTPYRTRAVEDLVRALKYDGDERAASLLAEVLAEYLREEIASQKQFSARPLLLSPVPLHASRERERGFNQVERILRHLPPEFHDGSLSQTGAVLVRTRATKQQTRLSRDARLLNVADAFALADRSLGDAAVILIDDVTTTGATLAEASKPLQKAGIPFSLVAIAHA
jgi:ComF family protein